MVVLVLFFMGLYNWERLWLLLAGISWKVWLFVLVFVVFSFLYVDLCVKFGAFSR